MFCDNNNMLPVKKYANRAGCDKIRIVIRSRALLNNIMIYYECITCEKESIFRGR